MSQARFGSPLLTARYGSTNPIAQLRTRKPPSMSRRRSRAGSLKSALLPLGGTTYFGLLMLTMDPKQGVEVIRLVKP
jgi:hypothetical protein